MIIIILLSLCESHVITVFRSHFYLIRDVDCGQSGSNPENHSVGLCGFGIFLFSVSHETSLFLQSIRKLCLVIMNKPTILLNSSITSAIGYLLLSHRFLPPSPVIGLLLAPRNSAF